MDTLKAVVWGGCLLAVGISLLDAVVPGKKFDSQLRLLFSVLFLIGFTAPILQGNFKWNLFSDTQIYSDSMVNATQNMEPVVNKELKRITEFNLEQMISENLNLRGISPEKISVTIHIAPSNNISISEVYVQASQNQSAADTLVAELLGAQNSFSLPKEEELSHD